MYNAFQYVSDKNHRMLPTQDRDYNTQFIDRRPSTAIEYDGYGKVRNRSISDYNGLVTNYDGQYSPRYNGKTGCNKCSLATKYDGVTHGYTSGW
jgi:hypothetical protein